MPNLPTKIEDDIIGSPRDELIVKTIANIFITASRDSRQAPVNTDNQMSADMTQYRENMLKALVDYYVDAWQKDGINPVLAKDVSMVTAQMDLMQSSIEFVHVNLKLAPLGKVSMKELEKLESSIQTYHKHILKARMADDILDKQKRQQKSSLFKKLCFVVGLVMFLSVLLTVE
ncbi:uncharacterized protein LOC111071949 [Drosophila obscura]|uniref:uncharacterized protein LOC111071949 n=1 Tax=Drosophila obscura TaxID=7282 RepID=UPI001BB20271|nr:uncharacterized protein LOC111071949 [Drosophila obscura]